jgi:hypothetical protein
MVTVAVPLTVTASVYVPGRTVTVAMPLFCAAYMAALIAVNWLEPSAATVIAVFEPVDICEVTAEVPEVVVGLPSAEVMLKELLWETTAPNSVASTTDRMVMSILRNQMDDYLGTERIGLDS